MKKLFILSLFFIAFQTSVAQNIGLRGGINLSNGTSKSDAFTLDTETLTGFQLGLTLEAPFNDNLFFNTALLYTSKGYKFSLLNTSFKAPITYLEIPLNIEYKESVGDIVVFAEAGPYVGIGLSAKVKTGNTTQDIDFGSEDDELKRMDFGLNFGGGIEFDKIRIGINYEFGLVNLENAEDVTTKLRNFAIFVGYNISSK